MRNIKEILYIITLCCIQIPAMAEELVGVAFESASWEYSNGVSFNGVTGELTIIGSPSEYRKAQLTITLPNNVTDVYLSAQVYFENIMTGTNIWEVPKLKMYPGSAKSGTALKTCNYSAPIEKYWNSTYCHAEDIDVQGLSQITIEFGMQNTSGIFKIKVPRVLGLEPKSTPYAFPYEIPNNRGVTLDLYSSGVEKFNNDLLSSNCHFNWGSQSWGDSNVQEALTIEFPHQNYRFPGGTVGNYYDYTTDGYQDHYSTFINPTMKNRFDNNWQFGYEGFKGQVSSSKGSATLMFNVMHDSPTQSKQRLQNRLSDGVKIKWIELGNENFFPDQAFGNISEGDNMVSVNAYINHTKEVTQELKSVDPTIQVAVPVNHLTYDSNSWSDVLSGQNYYDATVVHNYINIRNDELNFTTGTQLLNSYSQTNHVFEEYKTHFGNTPTLVSEWGVQGAPMSFLSVLAYADIFMALLDHSIEGGVVQQAGIHMFYHSDANIPQTLMFLEGNKTKYTAQGAMYSKLMNTFKGQTIFQVKSQSEELKPELPGVIARAVDYGDSIKVFAVNKLPQSSPLNVSLDGSPIVSNYTLESLTHDINSGWPEAYNSISEAWSHSTGSGEVLLPPYSVTVTTLSKDPSTTSLKTSDLLQDIQAGTSYELISLGGSVVTQGTFNSSGIEGLPLAEFSPGVYIIRTNDIQIPLVVD